MWSKTGPVAENMLHREIYERLKTFAKQEQITTYSEIAPLANLDMENPDHRGEIGRLLGIVSTFEHQDGRPLLSAIVVHRQDNIPGEGFFELARELGALRPSQDRLAFWCREVARVHEAGARDHD